MSGDQERELRNDMPRRWALALIYFTAQTIVALVYLAYGINNIVTFGIFSYVEHFTNWSWTLQTLFYFLTLPGAFVLNGIIRPGAPIARFTFTVVNLLFFPLNGIVWVIAVVIFVLLGTGSSFLDDILRDYPPSIVIIGNDVAHFVPLLLILVYHLVYRKLIHFSLNRTLVAGRIYESPLRLITFILLQSFVASGATVLIYSLIFNPQQVYETSIWTGTGVIVAALTLMAFNLIPLMIVIGLFRVGTNAAYSDHWLWHNHDDPAFDSASKSDSKR